MLATHTLPPILGFGNLTRPRMDQVLHRSSEVVIKPLERVTDEGQAHLWCILNRVTRCKSLLSKHCRVIRLIDLVRWEIRCIDRRR